MLRCAPRILRTTARPGQLPPAAAAAAVEVPCFGRRGRAERLRQERAAAAERSASESRRLAVDPKAEDAAWAAVSQRYGFGVKPAFHTWASFHHELARYDLTWRLASLEHYVTDVELQDTLASTALFAARCDMGREHTMSLLLHALMDMWAAPSPVAWQVGCTDPSGGRAVLHLHPYLAADGDPTPRGAADRLQVQVRRLATQQGLRAAADAPILADMALATLTSLTLRSIVAFFLRCDLGVRNVDLTTREHLDADVVPMWTALREAAGMHPARWPLDVELLRDGQ